MIYMIYDLPLNRFIEITTNIISNITMITTRIPPKVLPTAIYAIPSLSDLMHLGGSASHCPLGWHIAVVFPLASS